MSLYAANACFSTDLSLNLTNLTLFVPMEFPIKFDMVKSGWSIVYIEGPPAYN